MALELYLLRHATAEEGSTVFKDIERELTSRGIMEAAIIGKHIQEQKHQIDTIYCSPSFRTIRTADMVAEQLKDVSIEQDDNLFGGGPRGYLALVNRQSKSTASIMIVGHNPDITFFAEYLCRGDIGGSMEKATLIKICFDGDSWAEITQKSGAFVNRIDVADLMHKL